MQKRSVGLFAGLALISLLIASCIDSPDVQAEILDSQIYYIERVSVSSDGNEGNGGSVNSSASGDGRYIAFDSNANNLVAGDNNGQTDAFVYDRQTNTMRRASVSSDGVENSNGASGARISRDGRYVAFSAFSKTLVPRSDWMTDVFVRDISLGKTINLNTSSSGEPGNGPAFYPSFGHSDKFVVFTSTASNLVPGDNNGRSDVFIRNLENGTIERVSVVSDGIEGNGDSSGTSWVGSTVSSDGRYVIFVSTSTNLIAGETSTGGVFIRDRVKGDTKRIFREINSGQFFDVESLSISDDGNIVTFSSLTKGLVSEDYNNLYDIFVYNVSTGNLRCLSLADPSSPMIWHSYSPSLSADGRFVVFDSQNATLVPEDIDSESDIFVYDDMFSQMALVSKTSDELNADNRSFSASISSDGRIISFSSFAANMVPDDTNGAGDIFVVKNPYLSDEISGTLPVPKELMQKDIFGEVGTGKIINEGADASVDSIILSAKVENPDGNKVALEVWIESVDEVSGQWSHFEPARSEYIMGGEIATIEYHIPRGGLYTWRARAVDESGNISDWAHFGDNGINADFISSNFSFVFMTDVHLGSNFAAIALGHEIWEEQNVWSESRSYPRFTDVLYNIEKNDPRPDFILIGGDNVEYNNIRWLNDFKSITEGFTQKTGIEIYFVPGNHDRYDSESTAFQWGETDLSGGNDNLKNYFEVMQNIPKGVTSFFQNDDSVMDDEISRKGGYNKYNYYFNNKGVQFIGLDSGEDTGVMDVTPESEGIQDSVMYKLESLAVAKAYTKVIFLHNTVQDDSSSFTEFDNDEISFDNIIPDGSISNNWKKFMEYCKNNDVQLTLSGHTHEDLSIIDSGRKISLLDWRENKTYPLYIQTQSATKNDNQGYRIIDVINGDVAPQDAQKDIPKYEKVFIDLDAEENFESHVFDSRYEDKEINRNESENVFYTPFSDRTILYENTEKTLLEVKNNNDVNKSYDLRLQKRELDGEPNLSLNSFAAYAIMHQSCGKYGIPCIEGYVTVLKNNKWVTLDFSTMRSAGGSDHRIAVDWRDLGGFNAERIGLAIDDNDGVSYIKMKDLIAIDLNSPGELRVFNKDGNITGLVDGEIIENIPNSVYVPESETVYIYGNARQEVAEGLRTQVAGLYEATYDLNISLSENDQVVAQFNAYDILTDKNMSQQYKINWEVLAEGGDGVIMELDENKDGVYEKAIVSGADLFAPRAVLNMTDYIGMENDPLNFNASNSFDSDGQIMKYEWDFNGDGVYDEDMLGAIANHTYQDDFNGDMSLRVLDNDGLAGLIKSSVLIKNYSPQVNITKFEILESEDRFVLEADLFDRGIFDLHTATLDWGDGCVENIAVLQEPTMHSIGKILAYHKYDEIKEYMVKLEILDDDGGIGICEANFKSPRYVMSDAFYELQYMRTGNKKNDTEHNKAAEILEEMLMDQYWGSDYHLNSDLSSKFYREAEKLNKTLKKILLQNKNENFEKRGKVLEIIEKIENSLNMIDRISNYRIRE